MNDVYMYMYTSHLCSNSTSLHVYMFTYKNDMIYAFTLQFMMTLVSCNLAQMLWSRPGCSA